MSQKYELHEEMYKEGGWIEMMDGDLARQQEEKFLDFAEQREVEEKIMEIGEMRDEMGNFIVGELPQVVGDQLTWPTCPTKQQLETPIGESLKEFVRTRGEEFARRVEEEAGGGVVTQGHLFKVTQEWEDPPVLFRREGGRGGGGGRRGSRCGRGTPEDGPGHPDLPELGEQGEDDAGGGRGIGGVGREKEDGPIAQPKPSPALPYPTLTCLALTLILGC